MQNMIDLLEAQKIAEEAAIGAGRIILDSTQKRASGQITVEYKGAVDLVTETDKKCEEFIMAKLRSHYPNHQYVGEESSHLKPADTFSDLPTWFIDPLDGTTNYVHGYPFVCVCIGLTINKEPVVGVVHNPITNELYTAAKGHGAFLNGRKIHVTNTEEISSALIVNNVGHTRDRGFIAMTMNRLAYLLGGGLRALRNSGSAAQNMCHVAAGVCDVYFEDGYGGPWDVAAGWAILNEAGGCVTDIHGREFHLRMGKGDVICGNPPLVSKVAKAISTADRMRTLRKAVMVASTAVTAALVGLIVYRFRAGGIRALR